MKPLKVKWTESLAQEAEDIQRANLIFQWDTMEDIQDYSPYLEFGWYGFIPMIIYRHGT